MPPVPVPPEIDAFLAEAHPAVVGTTRPDGAPHTAPTWYDWEDGRILLNMEDTRSRLEHLRAEARVSISVLDKDYRKRDRPRFSAWVEPESWHEWPPRS